MARADDKRTQQKIHDARNEVRFHLNQLQTALDREVRWMPKGEKWLKPLTAFAAGLALTRGKKNK